MQPPGQPPNQQSSPMTVSSHDLLVMQQMQHQPPAQHTQQPQPGGVPGAPGQSMDQHQQNPNAQVNVGAPQPQHTMMPPLQLAPHMAAAQQAVPAAPKVNKKRQRGSRAIPIINPDTNEDLLEKIYNDSTNPTSSSSSVTSSTTVTSTSGPPPPLPSGPAGTGSSAPPPQANYSTIPPNVVPQVPLNNPPAVESDYDNYPPHPHQGTPELPGGMLLHHQAPPHLHHPPPNHPPPPTHVGHPVVPGQPMYDMGRSAGQQPHELVYTGPGGPLKTVVNPPPHLPPPPHHTQVVPGVPTAAEMTTASGTPVVSANANAPSVEIKPYQQKKKVKPVSEPPQQQQVQMLQQPPPPVVVQQQPHPQQMQQQPPQHPIHHQHQHSLPANINQPPPSTVGIPIPGMTDSMPIPYGGVGVPERYRTFSEKSIAESTLSTDAEPFVYTGPTSVSVSSSNNHQQQPPRGVVEDMPPPQQPVVMVPEMPPPPVVVVPIPMVVPEQQQLPPQQQEIPVSQLNKQPEVVEEPANKRTSVVDSLVAGVEKLSVEEQPTTATVVGGHNNNNNRKNKQHNKKRPEEVPAASETSSSNVPSSNKDLGSSKAPATTATTTTTVVVEDRKSVV